MNKETGRSCNPDAFPHKKEFIFAIDLGIDVALKIIHDEFETPRSGKPEDELRYHSSRHTIGVIKRTEKILRAIHDANPNSDLVTERDIHLGKLAAAFHDSAQEWKIVTVADPEGKLMRKRERRVGDSERSSVEHAQNYMSHPPYFTQVDEKVVEEAIMVTVPKFDPELNTVVQPAFDTSCLIAQAVALADLGGAGMEGAEAAKFEAIALYIEENPDYAMLDPKRLNEWLKYQKKFIKGRQKSFERELACMDERARGPVKELFCHFAEAMDGINELIEDAKRF